MKTYLIAIQQKDISRRHKPKTPTPRETFYSIEQLRSLWLPAEQLRPDYLRFLRFLIVCPLRMTEASELTRKNISQKMLNCTSHQMRLNKEAFTLPLP